MIQEHQEQHGVHRQKDGTSAALSQCLLFKFDFLLIERVNGRAGRLGNQRCKFSIYLVKLKDLQIDNFQIFLAGFSIMTSSTTSLTKDLFTVKDLFVCPRSG